MRKQYRQCKRCHEEKPTGHFEHLGPHQYDKYCKLCKAKENEWYRNIITKPWRLDNA